ncbi:hypothetical protein PsW64_01339 [Pseudovibrio sp. W64]|uniref:DUF1656 domain-containing protein n=1 Tax=unclassified Pseudovibrio TaxID=2627060 RepID=UPI0007B29FA4|nr:MULTISPECIES: DUF1656 domain-containing protein [unclassified Pseudovibrio]KZK79314.1 hypothetical protein PsAD46_04371 [Pseudovibrio sp. Ad46]KZK80730.1 hypothetical protein PsAD13_04795 [Pseudovibrio sp. Ad13]KZK86680.1 hypothetical protein PsW64_01339 [Pseudovibrio sp. W64]KZK95117.1 hypothetical protein PsW74_04122 [Pseudovibrio sp. W74]KZL02053.1 hypothetical protein PsAD5_00002 [Pseudovibrio sp. Ad5]
MNGYPGEWAIGAVYFPPFLIASFLGLLLSWITSRLLNRYRLSRFLLYPPGVFLALAVIYTAVIGSWVIPI